MHKDVKQRLSYARSNSIARHIKQTNIRYVQFSRGDCFVVRMAKREKYQLRFMWQSPAMVKELMSPRVFKFKTMKTGKVSIVHSRLDDAALTDQEIATAAHIAATFEKVEKLK